MPRGIGAAPCVLQITATRFSGCKKATQGMSLTHASYSAPVQRSTPPSLSFMCSIFSAKQKLAKAMMDEG